MTSIIVAANRILGQSPRRPSRLLLRLGALTVVAILVGTGFFIWHLRSLSVAESKRHISNLGLVLAEQTGSAVRQVDLYLLDALIRLRTDGLLESSAQGRAFH